MATTPSSPRLPSNNPPQPLSERRTKPSTPSAVTLSTVLKRIALVGFVIIAIWWIYVWRSGIVQDFFDPNDKIQRFRPEFRYVEPYSDKHRYRPAASPILKTTDRWGRVKHKGRYTP